MTIKRTLKALRSLAVDPLPRSKELTIESVSIENDGFRIIYSAKGMSFDIKTRLSEIFSSRLSQYGLEPLSPTISLIAMAYTPLFFKLSDFRTVRMKALPLDGESLAFFAEFLQGGLGEFRYLQGLNPARNIQVEADLIRKPSPVDWPTEYRVLMLNGGGKDTIVAGELLKKAGIAFDWCTVNSNTVRRSVVEVSGNHQSFEVGFSQDRLIEKNKVYPWGHFPHTSIVLALGLLVAQLAGSRFVCVGNERSANYGNLRYKGIDVNHQYSKSFVYEKSFAAYVSRCVTPDIKVFSLVRPFYDLHLAKIFSNFKRYHQVFVSCNRGIAHNKWCMSCAKCAFMGLALYPFAGREGVIDVFGEDILLRPTIRRFILDLVKDGKKPWECVGTTEENKLALKMVLKENPSLDFSESPFRADLEQAVKDFPLDENYQKFLEKPGEEHLIPDAIRLRLNSALAALGEPGIA